MAMTMTISNNSSAKRITVQIPTSSGDAIEAWVYLPEGSGPHPAVVMAHGIGGIKAGGLAPFAERFREEGFAAIAFDYRNFGSSGGQPRDVHHNPPHQRTARWLIALGTPSLPAGARGAARSRDQRLLCQQPIVQAGSRCGAKSD
jgi:dienelactone hydrolase